jgi:hypothetical protein
VGLATTEVERVLEELRHVELLRAVQVDEVAPELGLSPNPSLRDVAEAAPEPWHSIFDQHRAALLGLAEEVRILSEANRDLIHNGAKAVRELVESLHGEGREHYTSDGIVSDRPSSILLDQAL